MDRKGAPAAPLVRTLTSPRRIVSLLTSVVLVLAGLVVISKISSPSANAAIYQVEQGKLVWGIKESWRKYIGLSGTHVADGASITGVVEPGTQQEYAAGFEFPVTSGSFDSDTNTTMLNLAGSVHFQKWPDFTGPGKYGLDTQYSDLSLEISPTSQVIRGTHVGYSREDPGGELFTDPDVVLAKFDISGATTTFETDHSTWSEIPTFAGEWLRIYGENQIIDRASFDYTGPGEIPDLTETFDQAGVPNLALGAKWVSDSTSNSVSRDNRQLYVPSSGGLVHTVEINAANQAAGKLTITARDAVSLAPVGTSYSFGPYPNATRGQYGKTAYDSATGTVFFVTGMDGTPAVQTTVRAATWNTTTQSFDISVVGRLRDAATATTQVNLEALVWNPIASELAVIAPKATAVSAYQKDDLYRFVKSGSTWTPFVTDLVAPSTGEFAGAATNSGSGAFGNHASNVVKDHKALGIASDGSYVHAAGSAVFTVSGTQVRIPSQHIKIAADGTAQVSYLADTRPSVPAFSAYYGYNSVTTAADGSAVLYSSDGSTQKWVHVTVAGGAASTGVPGRGPVDAFPPYDISYIAGGWGADAARGIDWVVDPNDPQGRRLFAMRDDQIVAGYTLAPGYALNMTAHSLLAVAADGAVYLPIIDLATNRPGYQRIAFAGELAAFGPQPQSQAVTLASGEASRAVTFTSTVTGGSPAPTRQWQVKQVGTSTFSDLAGQTGATLTVNAVPGMDGTQYRAVYTSSAGRIASDVATLGVDYAPVVTRDLANQSVRVGTEAVFFVTGDGSPEPTTIWQRSVAGSWEDIPAGDPTFVVDGQTLRVPAAAESLSGTLVRAALTNEHGTTYTSSAVLTVRPDVVVPGEGLDLEGVVLEWTGSEELQGTPPFGGSNYFSAGVSAGDQATYLATSGNAAVLQLSSAGAESPATYASRAAHVTNGGGQLLRLTGGTGHLDQDGSATIAWSGSWTVNFYGGLVPFTLSDPVLTIDASGTGTLSADLSGYASSIDNPTVKTPLPPVADVVVSTLTGVEIDPTGTITITPSYAGVQVDVPAGQTPQNRTVSGWGAWPQGLVDFHVQTGLSSYWYSSGGAADPLKKPTPFTIDVTGEGSGPVVPGSDQLAILATVSGPTEPGEFAWSIDGTDRTVVLTDATHQGTHLLSTGSIKPITVTDTRTSGPAWSISGQIDATGDLPGSRFGWSPKVLLAGGGAVAGAVVAPGYAPDGPGLGTTSTLASAPSAHAAGSAQLGADLELRLPVTTAPGTYTTTLTLTALS